jgi:hypothetical protein
MVTARNKLAVSPGKVDGRDETVAKRGAARDAVCFVDWCCVSSVVRSRVGASCAAEPEQTALRAPP